MPADLLASRQSIVDHFVEVIGEELGSVLDDEWNRNADGIADDGLALPDLGDGDYEAKNAVYRYPSPTQEDRERLTRIKQEAVAAFVGFIGDGTAGTNYAQGGQKNLRAASFPFGAAILFNHVAQDLDVGDITDTDQDRPARPHELMHMRALRYLDALQWTVTAYGCFHEVVKDTAPRGDLPVAGAVDVGGGDFSLWAVSYYEFDVEADLLFPAHRQRP